MSKTYHYRQCGLEDVYLVNGFVREPTPYGETVKIHDIDGLHSAIGMNLIQNKKELAGAEIRFLRHELDLSQRTLGGLLGKSSQTVARWEKEQTPIDSTADRLLRLLYDAKSGGSRKSKIRELLEDLAELDSGIEGGPMQFEDTEEGWQQLRDAA